MEEGMKNSKNNKKKPFSSIDSSSLPLAPSSFQVSKKPFFMNYGDGGASGSGTEPYNPPLPSDLSQKLNDDNNKTRSNQQNPSLPSDEHRPSRDTARVDTRWTRKPEHEMDPIKLKRIMSNRASSQKSRIKKQQYVTAKEREAKSFEDQIAVLSPQVSLFKDKHNFLQMERKSLNRRIITYDNNSIVINAEIEANKAKLTRLREVYLSRQEQKMQQDNRLPPLWEFGLEEQLTPGPGQMVYANPRQSGDQYNGEYIEEILRKNQYKMKQVAVQRVDDRPNAAAKIMAMMPPGWGMGAPGQMPNPSFNFQSRPPQNESISNLKWVA